MALTRATDKIIANADGNLNLSGIVTATTIKVGSAISMTDNAISATRFHGDGSNLTGITGTTINNNAANKVITGSNTANTLEAVAKSTLFGNLNHGQNFLDDQNLVFGDASDMILIHQSSGAKSRIRNTNDSGSLDIESTLTRFTNKDGSTEKLLIKSDGKIEVPTTGKLSLGMNSPVAQFTAGTANGSRVIEIQGTDGVIRGYNRNGNAWAQIDFEASDYTFDCGGSEKLRIGSSGQIGIGGANYGSSGQVLTSQGASSTVAWTTPAGGKILKVHSVSSTTGQQITSSSYTDLTNLSITLTPASNSKCYVHVVLNGYAEGYNTFHITNSSQILRDSTEIAKSIRGVRMDNSMSINYIQNQSPMVMTILDTHGKDGSTSVTYKVRGKTNHGSMFVNTSFNTQSSITVYEVAPN